MSDAFCRSIGESRCAAACGRAVGFGGNCLGLSERRVALWPPTLLLRIRGARQSRSGDPRRPRAGLSLLEVLVATVILAGSLIVLTELASIGRRQVSRIDQWSTAQRLCRTKIDEVAAGIEQAENVENREFDGEPDWRYSIQTETTGTPGLTSVKVTVWRDTGESGIGAGKSGNAAISGKATTSADMTAPGNVAASAGGSGSTRSAGGLSTSRGSGRGGGGSAPANHTFTLVRWLQKSTSDGSDASTLPGGRRLPPGFQGGRRR